MGKAPTILSSSTIKKMGDIISSLDKQFQFEQTPHYEKLVNYSLQFDEPIHRWFKYREGYSTQIVDSVLKEVESEKLIVDPFCGCGTTLLAAQNLGYSSVGIDANPLSTFITTVKTRHYSPQQLSSFEDVCDKIKSLTANDKPSVPPKLTIINKVFLPDVLNALLILKHFIESQLSQTERDFFLLGWLSILENVSNVYKEGNGIKYRNRKRTPQGYVEIPIDIWQQSLFPENKFDYVVQSFLKHMKMMITDIRLMGENISEPCVITGDALAVNKFLDAESVGLTIFSPPYINNFNYFKAYKIELWMGGFVNSSEDLQKITKTSLRSHVETSLTRQDDESNWYPKALDELIELIDLSTLWTPRILQAIKGYFYDMRSVLKNIYPTLEAEGQCVIIVGNSAYGSTIIPTDSLLADIAQKEGFEVEKISVARHLTTSSQQKKALDPLKDKLRESIIYLKKIEKKKPNSIKIPVFNYENVNELPVTSSGKHPPIYIIKNQGLTESTHIIHKYPGKFIPHIPRWAINRYLNKDCKGVVVDPFCGSGTSLVEARLAGHFSYGIDIDPLARLISKVKTTIIPKNQLLTAVEELISEIDKAKISTFRPSINNLEHWFSLEAINDLGIIRDLIEKWRNNSDIYDFFVICLSAIIRRVSNADNQSLKTYVSGTHKKNSPSVKALFNKTVNEYAARVIEFGESVAPDSKTVILDVNDARKIDDAWTNQQLPLADLAITSPPYIKTIDYIYNQMAEYFWIGDLFDLENRQKQNIAKESYIGTEKVKAKDYFQERLLGVPNIDEFIKEIGKKSSKHSYIFYKFFDDMNTHFAQMNKVLSANGTYVMVVGDSSINDIPIPTHTLLSEIAKINNFVLENEFAYEIRNRYMRFPRQGRGGIIALDWIMTYKKKF